MFGVKIKINWVNLNQVENQIYDAVKVVWFPLTAQLGQTPSTDPILPRAYIFPWPPNRTSTIVRGSLNGKQQTHTKKKLYFSTRPRRCLWITRLDYGEKQKKRIDFHVNGKHSPSRAIHVNGGAKQPTQPMELHNSKGREKLKSIIFRLITVNI